MPLRVFMVTGTPCREAAATAAIEDLAEQGPLPRQRSPAALAGHLGDRAAEVEVDVVHAVLRAEDLGRLADVRRVGAVELHRADRLLLVEDQHLPGGGVTLDEAAAGDHLADVEARALLAAQPAVRRVGDAGHRCEHHRGRDLQRPQSQGRRGRWWCVLRSVASAWRLLLGRLLDHDRRLDRAGPGDRRVGLQRTVADLGQRAAVGRSGRPGRPVTDLPSTNPAGSGFDGQRREGVVEGRGLDQGVAVARRA